MTQTEFNKIMFSLRKTTSQMNETDTTRIIKMYLGNEVGLREYIISNFQQNPETYLSTIV